MQNGYMHWRALDRLMFVDDLPLTRGASTNFMVSRRVGVVANLARAIEKEQDRLMGC